MQITVSTVGLVDEMKRFVPQSRAQLALSLHATTDEVRVRSDVDMSPMLLQGMAKMCSKDDELFLAAGAAIDASCWVTAFAAAGATIDASC
eukprot:scaffold322945_cov23-Tisochrysis_lutea.AAC.1